jgi:hypothetical protein
MTAGGHESGRSVGITAPDTWQVRPARRCSEEQESIPNFLSSKELCFADRRYLGGRPQIDRRFAEADDWKQFA